MYTPAKGGHWRGNDPSDPTAQGAGSYRCAPTLRWVQMDSTVLARYRVRFFLNIHLVLALFQLETFLLCRQRLPQNWKILLSKGKPYFSGKHFCCVEEDHRDAGKWWEKKNLWRRRVKSWSSHLAVAPNLPTRARVTWSQRSCSSPLRRPAAMHVTPASILGQKVTFAGVRSIQYNARHSSKHLRPSKTLLLAPPWCATTGTQLTSWDFHSAQRQYQNNCSIKSWIMMLLYDGK